MSILINVITVKAFVVTPSLITKNSIILIRGYDKGYKFFSRLKFVCILIYFNKSIYFQWITKNIRIIK